MDADGSEDGNEGGREGADGDLSARLKRLEARLERQRQPATSGPASRSDASAGISPLGQAMRLSSEFIGGVVVGGALGWAFDYVLGTGPWGLMVFLLLGFATGVYNVMRSSGFLGKPTRKNDREGP